MTRIYLFVFLLIIIATSCFQQLEEPYTLDVFDSNLEIELIAEEPSILTPIGIDVDHQDAIYVLESHTHSPLSDYEGPKFDRIKRSVDENGDGKPERWTIFADSLEDGMNVAFVKGFGLYVTTKNRVWLFSDRNEDGVSDEKTEILKMVKPEKAYDHAAILGLACNGDGWLYVSRGNTGGQHWQIIGTDQSIIQGYGDGGNVFRCRMDGTQLEEVATGFWNPFDIKFTLEGRLLLTDNDPDSRGPNRLIEVVPGGNYGYKSLYGGSGIHPFLSWNGELPGTLPYAAPLGEAPCALIDGGLTSLGHKYTDQILVNVWEENNIVHIPLKKNGSTVTGKPEILVQGDSLFHPVAFAANSKGDLYITDWVVRQYPNHGRGKIWRLRSKTPKSDFQVVQTSNPTVNRFAALSLSKEKMERLLKEGDEFEKAIIRRQLVQYKEASWLYDLIKSKDPEVRLQALLIFLERKEELDKTTLQLLLYDDQVNIRRITLVYIGQKMRQDMAQYLQEVLKSGLIGPKLFETFLATIRHIQASFIHSYEEKLEVSSKKIIRKLPDSYIINILKDNGISEEVRALALPYLITPNTHHTILKELLKTAKNTSFQLGLLKALKQISGQDFSRQLIKIIQSDSYAEEVRSQSLSLLSYQSENYCKEVMPLLEKNAPLVQYATTKYLCRCKEDPSIEQQIVHNVSDPAVLSAWTFCTQGSVNQPISIDEWQKMANDNGNAKSGRLVFESLNAQCQTCHKVDGWGGDFGPNLSKIGSSKTKAQLVNSILKPSLEMAPEWQGWYVIDKDGVTHYGRQIDVHMNNVELMNASGEFDKYMHPKAYGASKQSLMPEGLQNGMTKEEFNDLIAYLMSLK